METVNLDEEFQSPAEAVKKLRETLEKCVYKYISYPDIKRHLRLLLETVTELRQQLESDVYGSTGKANDTSFAATCKMR